jgi:hypothetical protein
MTKRNFVMREDLSDMPTIRQGADKCVGDVSPSGSGLKAEQPFTPTAISITVFGIGQGDR